MNVSFKYKTYAVLLGMMLISITLGCSELRKLTYSEDFTYVEDKEVKSLMRKMEKGVERLGQIISIGSNTEKTQQQQVIAEISQLEGISAQLSAGHTQTNQLFISDHIEQFITDLATAKMFAKTTPADYSRIEKIVNNCHQCHKFR